MTIDYKCSRCGANLDVSPDTIVVICRYCSQINWIRGDLRGEVYIVKARPENDALNRFRKLIRWARIRDNKLIYIPYYIVDVRCDVDYEGELDVSVRVEKRRSRDGESVVEYETRTVRVYVSGGIPNLGGSIPVVARKSVGGSLVRHLGREIVKSRVETVPFQEDILDRKISKAILGSEVSTSEAMDIAIDRHLDWVREYVRDRMREEAMDKASIHGTPISANVVWERITPLDVEADASPVTYIPVYLFTYGANGEYKAYLNGWDLKPLLLEKPPSLLYRMGWIVSGIFGNVTLASIFNVILGNVDSIGVIAVSGIVLFALGGYISYYCIKKALRPVKVESRG